MTDFHKERLTEINKQVQEIKRNVLVLIGYLPNDTLIGEIPQNTTAMHFILLLAEAVKGIERAMRDILMFEVGSAYYDYIHPERTEAANALTVKEIQTGGSGQ